MKTLITVLVLISVFPTLGKIYTVSNMPNSPGEYTSITIAMGPATIGDTILVHGSSINYGPLYISKSGIVVIGAGHNPDKQFPYTTNFTDIDVYGNNVQLIGVIANSIQVAQSNFTMRRCKILGSSSFPGVRMGGLPDKNVLLESNVFVGGQPNIAIFAGGTDIVVIRNNVFSDFLDLRGGAISSQILIANNLFLKGPYAFSYITYVTISNNIFYGSSPSLPSSATLNLLNNISFQCQFNAFATGPNINAAGNLENVDPLFVNYPGGGVAFSNLHDYNLAPGSPGIASGSDGTDRGLYGGFGTIFSMRGEPPIAEIKSVAITSPTTVAPGGTLTVTITSKKIH
ncbi:MAG TPA: hypothetical protein VK666_29535 [Chryseolinea sp.]|nr:hypothetical protein [Chryseolinea sp.]